MDETDGSQDPYGPNDLRQELQDRLREVLERSKQPVADLEWTPEEQAELNAELARIDFNQEYANPDFADRKVTVAGEEVDVHSYNNFPLILSIVDRLNHPQEAPEFSPYEQIYVNAAEARKYPMIFAMFERASPKLYKRSLQLHQSEGATEDHRGREVSENELIRVHSGAYSAAAALARRLDPNYDLAHLR